MKCMIEPLIRYLWSMDVAEAPVLEVAGAPRFSARLTLAKTFEREKHHVENRRQEVVDQELACCFAAECSARPHQSAKDKVVLRMPQPAARLSGMYVDGRET
jgi:hypothetical protein